MRAEHAPAQPKKTGDCRSNSRGDEDCFSYDWTAGNSRRMAAVHRMPRVADGQNPESALRLRLRGPSRERRSHENERRQPSARRESAPAPKIAIAPRATLPLL